MSHNLLQFSVCVLVVVVVVVGGDCGSVLLDKKFL